MDKEKKRRTKQKKQKRQLHRSKSQVWDKAIFKNSWSGTKKMNGRKYIVEENRTKEKIRKTLKVQNQEKNLMAPSSWKAAASQQGKRRNQ